MLFRSDFQINFPENISQTERRRIKNNTNSSNISLHYQAPSDISLGGRHNKPRLAEYANGRRHLLLENTRNRTDKIISVIDRFLGELSTGLVWDVVHTKDKYFGQSDG